MDGEPIIIGIGKNSESSYEPIEIPEELCEDVDQAWLDVVAKYTSRSKPATDDQSTGEIIRDDSKAVRLQHEAETVIEREFREHVFEQFEAVNEELATLRKGQERQEEGSKIDRAIMIATLVITTIGVLISVYQAGYSAHVEDDRDNVYERNDSASTAYDGTLTADLPLFN